MIKKTSYLSRKITFLSCLTVFVGSFLLFQIQPLIAKFFLPWFGGSSAVWLVAVLFFQSGLVIGYGYTYVLNALILRRQLYIHALFVFVSVLMLLARGYIWGNPLLPSYDANGYFIQHPSVHILWLLAVAIGIPYVLLSATSTLVQSWFSRITTQKSPYSLYAISNAGSLLALVSYPFLVEPKFTINMQAYIWSTGLVVYGIILCVLIFLLSKYKVSSIKDRPLQTEKISFSRFSLWLGIPMVSSVSLLAFTGRLTQAVAPIPLLWVIPLGIFLFSYMVVFAGFKSKSLVFYALGLVILVIPTLLLGHRGIVIGIPWALAIYNLFLFLAFMLLHGQLYLSRPRGRQLPVYYLLIAIGGVLGGVFVNLISPLLFTDYWEFYITLYLVGAIACCTLISKVPNLHRIFFPSDWSIKRKIFVTYGLTSVFLIGLIWDVKKSNTYNQIYKTRNFYATLKVVEDENYRYLVHGDIIHGAQHKIDTNRPTMYYASKTGIAAFSKYHFNRMHNKPVRVAIIGLGVGTLASYGQSGDKFIFYELDSDVVSIAEHYFTFLKQSPAQVKIFTGDARLTMEKPDHFKNIGPIDLLVIDAFNGDSIPTHLLTQEAFDLYVSNLEPNHGVIAVNYTNNYLSLAPIIANLANKQELEVRFVSTPKFDDNHTIADWALLTKDYNLIEAISTNQADNIHNIEVDNTVSTWTDSYSNLAHILRW